MKSSNTNFKDISQLLSPKEFEEVKHFILKYGDRQTYRNFDNHNPHFQFKNLDVFLNAEVGQRNINNDPEISDFHELVMVDLKADIRYYKIIIVRKRTPQEFVIGIYPEMQAGKVYLVDSYGNDVDQMMSQLATHLSHIQEEIQNYIR